MAHDTPSPLVGGIPDDSTTPIALGTTGFTPRPRAQSAPRSRTRSFTAKLAALSRGPSVQVPLAAPAPSDSADVVASIKSGVPDEGPLLTVEQAYVLRAAAIDACELIVARARTLDVGGEVGLEWVREITLPELDAWIWAVAKDRPDYRKLERFALRNTAYF